MIYLLASSEDPDQTPRSAASDLGLHYLPMSQKWDATLIWVNGDYRVPVSESKIPLISVLRGMKNVSLMNRLFQTETSYVFCVSKGFPFKISCKTHVIWLFTVMILSFRTEMPGQTVQTQIRGAV